MRREQGTPLVGLGWRKGHNPTGLPLKLVPAVLSPEGAHGPGPLVFPQDKEEICKEEVVESERAVAESRQ